MAPPVGLTINQMGAVIDNLFNAVLIGDAPYLLGIIILIFITLWIVRSGSNNSGVLLVGALATVFYLLTIGLLPTWVGYMLLLIAGFCLYLAIAKVFFNSSG